MTKPFAGVRILDFTQVFAGPFGSYQLALLGADVIKIERQGGEDMRRSPLNKDWADRNMATAWMAINSNKRNLALDLTKPKAIEIVHRLAAKADVVMENFRPGDHGQAGYRLRGALGDQPAAHLLRRVGLRPERPGAHDGRLRRQDPGDERHHVGHRPSRERADARRLRRVRCHRRHDGGVRACRARSTSARTRAAGSSSMSPCSMRRCRSSPRS